MVSEKGSGKNGLNADDWRFNSSPANRRSDRYRSIERVVTGIGIEPLCEEQDPTGGGGELGDRQYALHLQRDEAALSASCGSREGRNGGRR